MCMICNWCLANKEKEKKKRKKKKTTPLIIRMCLGSHPFSHESLDDDRDSPIPGGFPCKIHWVIIRVFVAVNLKKESTNPRYCQHHPATWHLQGIFILISKASQPISFQSPSHAVAGYSVGPAATLLPWLAPLVTGYSLAPAVAMLL